VSNATHSGPLDGPLPTLVDVAHRAGVSRATASRVVNGVPTVSPDSRRRVQRAVAELGYVPNTAAASLVTRRSGQVALVVCGKPAESDAVLALTVRGVTAELAAARLSCLINVVPPDKEMTEVGRQLRTAGVDGAIVVADRRPGPLCDLLDSVGVPVATVSGRSIAADPGDADRAMRAHARRIVAHLAN
jgi:DNA-binding LacI/PurR family transcriptional regulator